LRSLAADYLRVVYKVRGTEHYPFTLILENEITAVPAVGIPIDIAGRKVVKISMFFTFGTSD